MHDNLGEELSLLVGDEFGAQGRQGAFLEKGPLLSTGFKKMFILTGKIMLLIKIHWILVLFTYIK